MPKRIQEWVLASPHASVAFSDFFERGGQIVLNPDSGLPYYNPKNPPQIVVDRDQWLRLKEPDAPEYPQRHMFGTLAHEIGHGRFNTGDVLFQGGSAEDYVRYRSGLEAQAIFSAFAVFKDLQNEPAFKQDFPFGSIGYLNGLELATMYQQWRDGGRGDKAVVEAIAAKVPDTPYTLANPPPDLNRDGAVTHRDAYLRDYQQLIRQHPRLADPPTAHAPSPVDLPATVSPCDRSLLEQIGRGSREALRAAGKLIDDDALERLSHALLTQCKDGRDRYRDVRDYAYSSNALSRVDHVVLSKDAQTVFAVEGRLDDPAHKRAMVPLAQAIEIPVEQSVQKLQTANRQIADEQARSRPAEPAREAEPPTPGQSIR